MAKVRVYELAKELGVESKTLLNHLKEKGEFVRSASSTIEAPVVRKIRETFPAELSAAGAQTEAKKPAAKPAARPAAPAPAAPAAPAPRPARRRTGAQRTGAGAPRRRRPVAGAAAAQAAPSAPAPPRPAAAPAAPSTPAAPAARRDGPTPGPRPAARPAPAPEAPAAREGGQDGGASRAPPRRAASGQQPLRPQPGHAPWWRASWPRGRRRRCRASSGQQPVRPQPGHAASAGPPRPGRRSRRPASRGRRSRWPASRRAAAQPGHDARPRRGRPPG